MQDNTLFESLVQRAQKITDTDSGYALKSDMDIAALRGEVSFEQLGCISYSILARMEALVLEGKLARIEVLVHEANLASCPV